MTHHAIHPVKQFRRDAVQFVSEIPGVLRRHVFGIVVTLVALVFTASVTVGFVLEGDHFAAILSAWIGGLSIAVGITYHAMGA